MKVFYEQIKEDGLRLERSFSFKEGDDNFNIKSFDGLIERTGDAYTLSGVLFLEITSVCDRCLEEFKMEFKDDIRLTLSPLGSYPEATNEEEDGLSDEEAGMYVTPKDHFELDDFLRDEAILLLPFKKLCRQDCKGLCPTCGANLNLGECSCKKETDIRFAALEKLKDKKS